MNNENWIGDYWDTIQQVSVAGWQRLEFGRDGDVEDFGVRFILRFLFPFSSSRHTDMCPREQEIVKGLSRLESGVPIKREVFYHFEWRTPGLKKEVFYHSEWRAPEHKSRKRQGGPFLLPFLTGKDTQIVYGSWREVRIANTRQTTGVTYLVHVVGSSSTVSRWLAVWVLDLGPDNLRLRSDRVLSCLTRSETHSYTQNEPLSLLHVSLTFRYETSPSDPLRLPSRHLLRWAERVRGRHLSVGGGQKRSDVRGS